MGTTEKVPSAINIKFQRLHSKFFLRNNIKFQQIHSKLFLRNNIKFQRVK